LNSTYLQQKIALAILRTASNRRLRQLLDLSADLNAFFTSPPAQDYARLLKRYYFATKSKRELALHEAEKYQMYFKRNDCELLFFKERDYSSRLLECPDAPITLFKKGNFDFNARRIVGIVGTRHITKYGKRICEDLIASLQGKDILVVSGLAYGVDVCVHQLCLKYGVPTVGVLGHGFDFMYPSAHSSIAREMQENGGLVSEFMPDVKPERVHFPMRNRIIAGMSDATIVVESGIKGGSLITAEMANGYNREVFAFPGSIYDEYSKGCNELIRNNKAILINSGEEFLKMMNWEENIGKTPISQPSLFDNLENLSENEQKIYRFIKEKKEVLKDDILMEFQAISGELFGVLLQLEMNNFIEFLPSGNYRCKMN